MGKSNNIYKKSCYKLSFAPLPQDSYIEALSSNLNIVGDGTMTKDDKDNRGHKANIPLQLDFVLFRRGCHIRSAQVQATRRN